MTLSAFCFSCLAGAGILLILGAIHEEEVERRKRACKRVRELNTENAKLRAELRKQKFDGNWQLDTVKTQLAAKDLLLRQKWAGVK